MPKSLIVIAGSADPERTDYEPSVDVTGARKAARELGIALAKARCRSVVFHCDFIEADVVGENARRPLPGSAAARQIVPL